LKERRNREEGADKDEKEKEEKEKEMWNDGMRAPEKKEQALKKKERAQRALEKKERSDACRSESNVKSLIQARLWRMQAGKMRKRKEQMNHD
jgi:hypothetical protein